MTPHQKDLLRLHIAGYFQIVLHLFGLCLLVLWALQVLSMIYGFGADWSAVLQHLFLLSCFVAFCPGQKVWTYRILDEDGRSHVVVGIVGEGDEPHGLPKDS